MSSGSMIGLLIGLALLIGPVWVLGLSARRLRRLSAWPRAQGTVRHVWTTTRSSSATGTSTTEKVVHARYEFADASGRQQVGECAYLKDPKVGDPLEVMYSPETSATNQPVHGGSVIWRTITWGFVVIFFGGLGVFVILAALGAVSM
ncbi:DUF3592 domain-containing protein [Kribbella sp. NBC_00482]|uniref:DUF3592 domain-containing protein n=1 Tax=Kribbella sp. NBC_00482 TaxID=2975968 RepID=UPI002E18A905